MIAPQFDAVKEATDAFTKLFKGRAWLLGAPTLAGAFLIGVVIVVVVLVAGLPAIIQSLTNGGQVPQVSPAQVAFIVIGFTIGMLAAIAVSAFTYGWTLVAADPVWLGRDPAFDRGFNRAGEKLLTLVAYLLLVALISLVSIIIIVGPIIVAVLTIYGPCFILFGNRSATEALGDSYRLATENLNPTIVLALACVAVYIMVFAATFFLSLIPFLGLLAQIAAQGLLSGYVALIVVRFYELLSSGKGSEPPYPLVPETRS